MKTKQLNHCMITIAIGFSIAITGCKKEEPEPTPTPDTYETGIFITNEGVFSGGTGTISFYNRTAKTVSNNIFETENGYPLGNIAQSMDIHYGKGYIVVNNAGKIEVVNASTFKSAGVINGLTLPRYFLGIDNNKAYVSEWGTGGINGTIQVIDLNNNSITSSITTGKGPEKIIKSGNFIYVACNGGYEKDSVVVVIDATTDAIVDSIIAGPNPSDIEIDQNGNIWVSCLGQWKSDYSELETTGRLVKINSSTNTVVLSLPFSSLLSSPYNLSINTAKNKLYYTYDGKVYSHDITATSLNTSAFINRSLYGIGIDPLNDDIYGSDAGDFISNGWTIRYNSTGIAVDSFQVGIIPSQFCFN